MSDKNDVSQNSQNTQPQQPQQPSYGYQQQPPYGYQQQPQQQPYGYQQQPQQPPYGYQQQPQQPYGYQQQPQPQQPYYAAPQPAAAPVVVAPVSASPAEKDAAFSSASTIFMLILCIVYTINLVTGLVGKIITLDIGGLLLYVLEILIVVGIWITFANAKKKKLSSTGISLIRVPYIIQFVFAVLGFAGNLLIWIFTLNIISLIIGLITFIFQCICFSSVNKTLKLARDINQNKSVIGRKAGSFAAIVMIIYAVLNLISEIVGYITLAAISAALEGTAFAWLGSLIGGGGIMVIVVAVVAFLASISGAIVMLQFGKKIKVINGG